MPSVRCLVAKIQKDNQASINLFTKLGFVQTKVLDVFNEIHFTL